MDFIYINFIPMEENDGFWETFKGVLASITIFIVITCFFILMFRGCTLLTGAIIK
jgi:hypothetical protein